MASDAVPIYLNVSTGKVCIPIAHVQATSARKIHRQHLKLDLVDELAALDISAAVDACGASRGEKDRLTWWCRQLLPDFLSTSTDEVPQGKMGISILIVTCSIPCRLEDICPHTNLWLRDVEFDYNGKHYHFQKGTKVSATLMKSWRALRAQHPVLFTKGVRVWGQPSAYQDSVLCCWHSELIKEETGGNGAIHLVDMFSGEWTEDVLNKNYVRQQTKVGIGPKVTAKIQPTDVKFAKLGKDAMRSTKIRLRRLMRQRAALQRTAPILESKAYECLCLVIAAHEACVLAANEHNAVLESFRMSGYLAYECAHDGFRPAVGAKWKNYPLCSSRLDKDVHEKAYSKLDEHRVPLAPDWQELYALQNEAKQEAAKSKLQKKAKVRSKEEPRL